MAPARSGAFLYGGKEMKTSKIYNINTLDGLRKAEKAYIRLCNKYISVRSEYLSNGDMYFIYY